MTRIKGWMCLTLAAALALLVGGRRLAEGASLDSDNMTQAAR